MQKLPFGFTSKEIVDQGRTSRENIDAVKQWLSSVDCGIIPPLQDELVVIFLLSCDNDLPLTKNTITMYYKCKRNSPDIFDNRQMDHADLKKAMNSIYMCSLPVRTDENYAIHHFKLKDTNYLNFDLVPVMKLSYMLLDVTQEKDLPRGLVVIIDCKGVGLMHLTRMKIGPMKRYFQFLQEGFPIQMKTIHIINAVYFFDKFLNVVKLCTKSELMEMIQVHPPSADPEKLFALVPKKCWPEDYGGDLPSTETLHEKTIEQFEEKQEFWRLEEEIRCRNAY